MAESLQRVYGVAFPDTKLLKEWKARQEMAARADHHRIGKVLIAFTFLFFFPFLLLCRTRNFFFSIPGALGPPFFYHTALTSLIN
jgi:hypothetical protein